MLVWIDSLVLSNRLHILTGNCLILKIIESVIQHRNRNFSPPSPCRISRTHNILIPFSSTGPWTSTVSDSSIQAVCSRLYSTLGDFCFPQITSNLPYQKKLFTIHHIHTVHNFVYYQSCILSASPDSPHNGNIPFQVTSYRTFPTKLCINILPITATGTAHSSSAVSWTKLSKVVPWTPCPSMYWQTYTRWLIVCYPLKYPPCCMSVIITALLRESYSLLTHWITLLLLFWAATDQTYWQWGVYSSLVLLLAKFELELPPKHVLLKPVNLQWTAGGGTEMWQTSWNT